MEYWVEEASLPWYLYLVSVYKFSLFVIPAPYHVQGKLRRVSRLCPCEGRELLRLDSRFHGNDKKRKITVFMDRLYLIVFPIFHHSNIPGLSPSSQPWIKGISKPFS